MPRKIDLQDVVGKRFGKIVVLALYDPYMGSYRYTCLCDCGNEFLCMRYRLIGQNAYPARACRRCTLKKTKAIHRSWSNESNYQKENYKIEKIATINGWHTKYVKKNE